MHEDSEVSSSGAGFVGNCWTKKLKQARNLPEEERLIKERKEISHCPLTFTRGHFTSSSYTTQPAQPEVQM